MMWSKLFCIILLFTIIECEESKWRGIDKYSGVGFGIGLVESKFSVNLTTEKDSIKGTGKDENGYFTVVGTFENFEKIYSKSWCDSILYKGTERSQGWVNGSYR